MSHVLERVHTDPRLRRRRKAVARSRRRKLFVRSAVLITLLFVVWAVLWSPLLNVRDVRLRGARHTTAEEVVGVLDLGSGTNLLRLSTEEIEAGVMSLPWVRDVAVSRVLPDTLQIRIKEREPAMVLSLGAANWIVDATGRVLDSGRNDDLPILAGTDLSGIEIGTDLKAEQLIGGLRVYRSLKPAVRKKVAAIFAPTPERITLALKDGSQVRYGSAELLRAKSNVLASLLQRLQRDGTAASYIDLRVPTSPAVSAVAPVVPAAPVAPVEAAAPTDPIAEVAPTDATAETEVPDGTEPLTEEEEAPSDATVAD
jgi:cell division protein FtsQ